MRPGKNVANLSDQPSFPTRTKNPAKANRARERVERFHAFWFIKRPFLNAMALQPERRSGFAYGPDLGSLAPTPRVSAKRV